MRTASWVVRDRQTGNVICEIFERATVAKINTAKCTVVPILQHLQEINRDIRQQPILLTGEKPQ